MFGLTHGATQHNEFSVRILTQIFPKSQGEIPIVFRALAKKRRAAGERLSRSGTMAPSCPEGAGHQGADGHAGVFLVQIERGQDGDAQLQLHHGQDGQFIFRGPADVGVDAGVGDDTGDVIVIGPVL